MVRGRIVETFNTHQMSDEVVHQLQTARDREVRQIMQGIRTELKNPDKTRQHFVVYGPHGSGKSFLMRLIDLQIKKLQEVGEEIRFVLLPEEQYNIRSAPRLIQIIATHLRGAGWSETGYRIDLGPEEEVWQKSVKDLETAMDQVFGSERGLVVVVVENFDQLLVKMFGAGTTKGKKMQEGRTAEERLRRLISQKGVRLMLIATATGTVDQDYDRPLFRIFRSVNLKPWTPDDYLAYFNRRRALDDQPELSDHERARTLAISQFTGGNPRLAQLLYDTLNAENMLDITSVLDALADELADYYKGRIEDLPETSAGLLDALIRGGEPESQSGLAKRVGADQKRIADSFKYLTTARLLSASRETGGKALLYRVSDRLFVYFYRRRYGDPDAANPLVRITELLESFLSNVEKEDQALNHLEQGDPIGAQVYIDLLSSGRGSRNYSDGGVYRAHSMLIDLLDEEPSFLSSDEVQKEIEILRNGPEKAFVEWKDKISSMSKRLSVDAQVALLCLMAIAAARSRLTNKASKCLRQAHDLAIESQDPDSLILIFREMSMFSWHVDRDKETSVDFLDKAGKLARSSTKQRRLHMALSALSFVQGYRGEYEASVATTEEAVDLAIQMGDLRLQAQSLRHKAYSLGQLNQHQEAVATAEVAADLAAQAGDIREQAMCLRHKAYSLDQVGEYYDAAIAASCGLTSALKADSLFESSQCLFQALISAGKSPFEKIMSHVDYYLMSTKSQKENGFTYKNTYHLILATEQICGWENLFDLIIKHQDFFSRLLSFYGLFFGLGRLWAESLEVKDRPGFYSYVAESLPIIAKIMNLLPIRLPGNEPVAEHLQSLIGGLTQFCTDPGVLRDLADLIREVFGSDGEAPAQQLEAFAHFHASGRTEASLEKMDPDMATAIRRIWNLSEPEDVLRQRWQDRRKRGR